MLSPSYRFPGGQQGCRKSYQRYPSKSPLRFSQHQVAIVARDEKFSDTTLSLSPPLECAGVSVSESCDRSFLPLVVLEDLKAVGLRISIAWNGSLSL